MTDSDEVAALRDRLSRLSEASLRINESLDFDSVLQEVLDSACSLTGARYGVIMLLDHTGQIEDALFHGLNPDEARLFDEFPEGPQFFEYLGGIAEPLRVPDFHSHTRSLGLPEFRPPIAVSPILPFLAAPIRHGGERVGAIYVGETETGREFTPEDEEILVMFASQAALVISNARRYRDEQRAKADLETLINISPVGVVVFDAKSGQVTSTNREARRIFAELHGPGGSPEDLLDVLTIRRGDGREIALDELSRVEALSAGETVRLEEMVIRAPDGRSVTTLMNGTPIRGEDGSVESFVITVQDMTPLGDLERLRTEFLGMVSHELRGPLTSIKGSTTTLLKESVDLDPAEIFQFHRIIDEQADRMRDLIGDLLDMAHIEAGTLPVVPQPAEVSGLVDRARNTFLSGGGRQHIHVDLPPDLPMVMADTRRIMQVLGNLLANASRYSPASSTIWVAAAAEDVHIAISVADEGKGVSAERLPHLFRKYSRLDAQDAGLDIGGSGLGLAICKGFVEAHGGRIWAESNGPGLGARFTFTLPVVAEAVSGSATGGDEVFAGSGSPGSEPLRILAVDDDPRDLRYVREVLSRAGYAPIVTGDPDEVPRLVKSKRPRLVLLDLMLPGTDGIELMQDILRTAELPVIFLSAYGRDEVIAKAFENGAADYVVKPFSPTELVARIQAALRKRAAVPQNEPAEPFHQGDLVINYSERRVILAGEPIHLTPTEYGLLAELSRSAGRVLTHDQLLQRVWGLDSRGDARVVRAVVKRLRGKLGDAAAQPTYIFTEPHIGYRMPRAETPDSLAGAKATSATTGP